MRIWGVLLLECTSSGGVSTSVESNCFHELESGNPLQSNFSFHFHLWRSMASRNEYSYRFLQSA